MQSLQNLMKSAKLFRVVAWPEVSRTEMLLVLPASVSSKATVWFRLRSHEACLIGASTVFPLTMKRHCSIFYRASVVTLSTNVLPTLYIRLDRIDDLVEGVVVERKFHHKCVKRRTKLAKNTGSFSALKRS